MGYMRLNGYRSTSVNASLSCRHMLYFLSVCDDSTAEAAYAAVVALYYVIYYVYLYYTIYKHDIITTN